MFQAGAPTVGHWWRQRRSPGRRVVDVCQVVAKPDSWQWLRFAAGSVRMLADLENGLANLELYVTDTPASVVCRSTSTASNTST